MSMPDPHDPFDAVAEEYDQALNQGLKLTGSGKDFFAEGRIAWVERRLRAENAVPLSVMDFGCGTGSLLPWLRKTYPAVKYLGYDPSRASIEVARARYSNLGDAEFVHEASALRGRRFDLAFTNGVFHHIEPGRRAEAMALIHAALAPGGHFAFWENNRWNPMVHLIMSRVSFDRDAQLLFPHQARGLLRGASFEVISTDYLFVFPAALKPLRRLEPALAKLPLGGQYLVLAKRP